MKVMLAVVGPSLPRPSLPSRGRITLLTVTGGSARSAAFHEQSREGQHHSDGTPIEQELPGKICWGVYCRLFPILQTMSRIFFSESPAGES